MKSTATWVAAGLLVLSTSALADTVTVKWDSPVFNPLGSVAVTYSIDSGATTHGTSAGRFQGTVTAFTGALTSGDFVNSTSDFFAYCTELTQTLGPGQTIVYTRTAAAARVLDWIGAVNSVLGGGNYAWLHPASAAIAAAVQLGIWEAIYDSSATWSLTAGTFRASTSNATTNTEYALFRAAVENPSTPDLPQALALNLVNGDSQNVIGGLPEPGSLMLLGLGAALAGWTLRRKHRA
jgi:hypothetical protein